MLSSPSRKDESNAVFPVSLGLPGWVLEAISPSCMARANGTCHVPFREHPGMDSTASPLFPRIERRRSGPNQISRSAAITKFVKSRGTCHRHMPSGTKHFVIDLLILLSSFQAEQSLSGTNPFSCSCTRSKRVKTRVMCQWHVAQGTENDAIDLVIFQSLN